MLNLQEFSEQQEIEFCAAVTDVRNAIAKFGPDVLSAAILDDFLPEEMEDRLTDVYNPDILIVH